MNKGNWRLIKDDSYIKIWQDTQFTSTLRLGELTIREFVYTPGVFHFNVNRGYFDNELVDTILLSKTLEEAKVEAYRTLASFFLGWSAGLNALANNQLKENEKR